MAKVSVTKNARWYGVLCKYIFPLVLLLYPLRHIWMGLDLRDTGYNYANFLYMGLDHMDSMWLFSTYLATAVGHFFTLLPGGQTLVGMNLYTGLFVSVLAFVSYRFFTRRLQLPAWLVFVGEFVAISLCWCPTALLYNYLTYLLFLAAVLLLYKGLTQDKGHYLVLAGVVLGTNVFVRFSNLPEAALILAVWGYGIICRKKVAKVLKETGLCILGYAGAVALWLGYFALRYGLFAYVAGIKRLFAMTDTASDYKPVSMLYGIFSGYIQNFYWVNRLLVFLVLATVVCFLLPKRWKWAKRIIGIGTAAVAGFWLYSKEFCDLRFDEYSSMLRPGILFLILTLFVCALRILQKKVDKKEKLLAMLIALVTFLTSVGGNNGLISSINNLFFAVPYVLWNIYKLCKRPTTVFWRVELTAVKAMAVMFICIFLFQSIGFGTTFVFVESSGAKNVDTKVENNDILSGVYMSKERAEWVEEISAYVEENQLAGREVILYGQIPALSFYLQMPSAFNPWSDLLSYSADTMEKAMGELEAELSDGAEPPVVIFDKDVASKIVNAEEIEDKKLAMILDFMNKYGYIETFSNAKFVLYEAEKRD